MSGKPIYRPAIGVASYDVAQFSYALPDLSNVHSGSGMASVWQRNVQAGSEILVPPSERFVLLARTGPSYRQFCRISGRAIDCRVSPDFLITLPAGVESFWGGCPEMVRGWFHLHFEPKVVVAASEEFGCDLDAVMLQPHRDLRHLVMAAIDLTRKVSPSALVWDSLMWLILHQLANVARTGRDAIPRGVQQLAPWQARRAIEYMRENLDRDVALAELADLCHISQYHFARGFRNSVGQPPHRYLMLMRLDRARDLLANSTMPVIEVALSVGYQTPQAFARAFRKVCGATPSAFRKEAGQ